MTINPLINFKQKSYQFIDCNFQLASLIAMFVSVVEAFNQIFLRFALSLVHNKVNRFNSVLLRFIFLCELKKSFAFSLDKCFRNFNFQLKCSKSSKEVSKRNGET